MVGKLGEKENGWEIPKTMNKKCAEEKKSELKLGSTH